MSLLTTHVIDTARGVPAAGIAIDLYRVSRGERCHVRSLTTNAGGRFDEPHHVPLFLSPFSYTVYRGS